MKIFIALLLSVATIVGFAQKKKETTTTVPSSIHFLEQEIARLSVLSGGKLGVAALHIESGKSFSQWPEEKFPMASSYKIPIAVEVLTKVDSGKLSLDQMIELSLEDLHPGSGMLSERFNWPNVKKPGVALSVRSLLELMLLISDNSATDLCLRLAGGPAAVNACIKRWGINGMSVDRPTAWLIADFLGIHFPMNKPWPSFAFDSLAKKLTPEQEKISAKLFDEDPRDCSTPQAMIDLLLRIYTKPLLKTESQQLLLDIMRRCETGLTRLKGSLPPNTEVIHKTGTIGMTTNDVGIMTLPGDAGHVAIAVFVKSSSKEIPERERAIAEVTRAIHDYFILVR
ncbi:MAG: class A beta-lactamase [Bacteroidetes bacterium]|nr:class A beta-lactamase [Bacteroidota bacterium]